MFQGGILALLFLMAFPAWGAPRPIYCNLRTCTEIALRNNEQIRAAEADIELSKGKEAEAHPRGIPVLKYQYRLAPVPRNIDSPGESFFAGDISVLNAFKIELGAPITTFGRLSTAQDLAQLGIDASWFKRQKTSDDVVLKVHQVYYGLLFARELLNLGEDATGTIQGKIDDAKKQKVIDQLGILKLKVGLFELLRKVEEGKEKEKLAMAALKVQMGLEQDVPVFIQGEDLTPIPFTLKALPAYLSEAHGYLPEFKLLATGLKAKGKQLTLEKKGALPVLGWGGFFDIGRAPNIVGGEKETSFSNPFNYTKLGVGFQLEGTLDTVKTKAKIEQAKADLLKTANEKAAATKGLELDITKSYYDVVAAQNLMNQAAEEKKTARQMVFLTKSNIDIGIGETKDYLDALQSYLIFQGRELEAIFNYNVAVSELQKRTGENP